MRNDEAPPWSRRKVTWWSLYGRAVKWFSVAWAFVLLPVVILFFVDQAEALERLRILGIGVVVVLGTLLPAAWYYNRRDGAHTQEFVQVVEDHGEDSPRSSR
ncbi:hypothetical protein [Amycolatopsis sp. NPDC051071]|uniref:hypothetical protein n=1 Tax=Amycolatopsis sp. NPDC051071 TaxID=3154637 RepID=UPI00343278D4